MPLASDAPAAEVLAHAITKLSLHEGDAPQQQQKQVAGSEEALQALRELIGWPSMFAEEGRVLGVSWPRGLLLHGPPGCGKTLLVQTVVKEYGASLHVLTASTVFGAFVGESERRLREVFEAAARDALEHDRVAVVFLDEVDSLCPRRDGTRQHEARVVAQLLTLLDGAATPVGALGAVTAGGGGVAPAATAPSSVQAAGRARRGRVVVVAATNRPNAVDPALRRRGRLDREVAVAIPNAQQRTAILKLHTQGLPLAPDVNLAALAGSCHGYSGADLASLAREAAMHAFATSAAVAAKLRPLPGSITPAGSQHASAAAAATPSPAAAAAAAAGVGLEQIAAVCAADFEAAMHKVGPSVTRGAESEVAPVGWNDIGGLHDVKQRLQQAVEWPLKHADAFKRMGLSAPRGVLLHGPPGCSKTTMARAAATASRATFMALSCAQLYSMYVGEGEAVVRDAFKRACMAAPAIIFLDEIDAVAVRRSDEAGSASAGSGSSEAGVRLLSTLLTEMDGLQAATGVLVLAATNRPAALDTALTRPGRFDVALYVPPPDEEGREAILRIHSRKMPLAADVDLAALARDTENFTGAELAGVCREAAIAALREDLHGVREVSARHFEAARAAMRPAITPESLEYYISWQDGRGR